MEIQPLAVLFIIDEVGTVALPKGQTTHVVICIEGKHQNARSQEASADGLAVVSCLDDLGCQGMHGDLTHGTSIEPGDLIVLLDHIGKSAITIGIVVTNAVVPDLVKAGHNAKQMTPGCLFAGIPELAPLFLAVRGSVEVGMPGMEIFRCLDALSVVNTLGQSQMCFHLP
jgi:hypothetical protein